MTQTAADPVHWEERRHQWVARVESLISQVEQWATAEGWATARSQRTISERLVGQYDVPLLRVRVPEGEVHVIPVGLHAPGWRDLSGGFLESGEVLRIR